MWILIGCHKNKNQSDARMKDLCFELLLQKRNRETMLCLKFFRTIDAVLMICDIIHDHFSLTKK